jgi:anaerobic selenocysteine-containing dehydrogenase
MRPKRWPTRCGVTAPRIRQLAAELARCRLRQASLIDQPWTDFRGNDDKTCRAGRSAFHAMRGISAHSNGFQTCRALHLSCRSAGVAGPRAATG